MYILSENIRVPIAINVVPEIYEEYFLKKENNLDFKLILEENIGINTKGIAKPNE